MSCPFPAPALYPLCSIPAAGMTLHVAGSNAHERSPLFSKLFSVIINHFYNQGGETAIKSTGSCKEYRKFLKTALPQVLAMIVSRWREAGCTQDSFVIFSVEREFMDLEFWRVVS